MAAHFAERGFIRYSEALASRAWPTVDPAGSSSSSRQSDSSPSALAAQRATARPLRLAASGLSFHAGRLTKSQRKPAWAGKAEHAATRVAAALSQICRSAIFEPLAARAGARRLQPTKRHALSRSRERERLRSRG